MATLHHVLFILCTPIKLPLNMPLNFVWNAWTFQYFVASTRYVQGILSIIKHPQILLMADPPIQ